MPSDVVAGSAGQLFGRESSSRQPVHTVYGGAHLYSARTPAKLGALALRHLRAHVPDFTHLADILEYPGRERLPRSPREIERLTRRLQENPQAVREENGSAWLAHTVYRRVVAKLEQEPVEDLRIDFEDGYGYRPQTEELEHAGLCGQQMASALQQEILPPFCGIRIKALGEGDPEGGSTLEVFLDALIRGTGGRLPDGFVVTLPKVVSPLQVSALADILDSLETRYELPPGVLALEIMVETPQAIFDGTGACALPRLVEAARGRCVAAHFGAYDFTAACGVVAPHQHLQHPLCDFARNMMQTSLAGRGIRISDGATNILPIETHRAEAGMALPFEQQMENRRRVLDAWALSRRHIEGALRNGIYQGWDLHPAQLPIRYAVLYTFFLSVMEISLSRLRSFLSQAARASRMGSTFDDAATGQGLLNFFLRGLNCRAFSEQEIAATGLSAAQIRTRSFEQIVAEGLARPE